MRKLFTILAALLLTASVFAQSPEKMSYQAVIRNSSDVLVTDTQVGMQISILQGAAEGSPVYVETQTPTTNANGLVSVEIGTGTTSDDFTAIDWAAGPCFIKTEIDPAGGTSYSITGTSQLLSVPYALHAKTAEYTNAISVKGDTPCNAATKGAIRYNETTNTLEFCNGSNWISMASGLSIGIPQISTTSISEITTNAVTTGGAVIANGGAEIFEKGFCWNTEGTPTKVDNKTDEGSGNGSFSSFLSGLTSFENYFLRSYATNTAGTGYGDELSFKTKPEEATVTTKESSFVDFNAFSTGGTAEVIGKETIEEKGVVYGKNANPTKSDNYVAEGTGTGDFRVTLANLDKTLYFYRAYAINEAGVSYGNEKMHTSHVDFNGNSIAVMPTSSGAVKFVSFYEDSGYEPIAISNDDGQSNAAQLISRFGTDAEAAHLCDTLTAYGFSDWYLPARDELNAIHENNEALGYSAMDEYFWSSTEVKTYGVAASAWAQDIANGGGGNRDRTSVHNVVCIRKDNK